MHDFRDIFKALLHKKRVEIRGKEKREFGQKKETGKK
jgi:hypothetical protein